MLFALICVCGSITKKKGFDDNVLYVGEQNLTEVLSDIPAAFMLNLLGGERDDRFKDRMNFISMASNLGSRCYFVIMDGDRSAKFTKSVQQNEPQGYYFFRYGHLVGKYNGKRDTEHFVDFVMSRTGIPFKTFDDYVVAQDFVESNDFSVVLFLKSAKGPLFEKYGQLASQLRDNFTFGLCADEDIADELGIHNVPSLVLYRSSDSAKVVYSEPVIDATTEDIVAWLKYNTMPLFFPFSLSNQNIYRGSRPVILFFTPVEEKSRIETLALVSSLSEQYGEDLHFTQIDAVTGSRFMTGLGFSKYADPAVAILVYSMDKMVKYIYPEDADWNRGTIADFVESFLDNRLTPHIRSLKLPDINDGPVIEANTDLFETLVLNENYDCLLMYYESWDRIYQEFLPDYISIAELLINNGIKLMKISIADNDLIHGPEPKKSPALYLFTKGLKNRPIPYIGELKKKLILQFIEDEIGIEL